MLHDRAGFLLAFNDDFSGLNSQLTYRPNVSGTYFLSARDFDVGIGGYRISAHVQTSTLDGAANNILRVDSTTSPLVASLSDQVRTGALTTEAAVSAIVAAADATTSVATLAYQFFTGRVPTAAGLDYLISPAGPNPNNLNSDYFQGFNLENRYINFAVNLGKLGEGRIAFTAEYGSLSLAEATKLAYGEIFGAPPTNGKVAAILTGGRDLYFAAYGGDGLNGIGTKAAMVGWLLAEAEKANVGVYARSNAAFLTDLADGAAYNVDLIGIYSRPEYVYLGGA